MDEVASLAKDITNIASHGHFYDHSHVAAQIQYQLTLTFAGPDFGPEDRLSCQCSEHCSDPGYDDSSSLLLGSYGRVLCHLDWP